jgi:FKBP-type peptidyl-prolyl cis-trans isomerase FkpA
MSQTTTASGLQYDDLTLGSGAEAVEGDYVSVHYSGWLQNPDGSFSTNWFEARGNHNDPGRKLQTTGHMLEWLVYTLPDDQLQSPRMM